MAITMPVTPTTATSGVAATTITCNTPSGLVPGDVLFYAITHQNATVDAGQPTGFSTTPWCTGTTTGLAFMVYTRICDGTEAASYTSQTLTSARIGALMLAYRGVNPTTIKDVANATATTGTTAITYNALTPVTPGAWILGWGTWSHASGIAVGTYTSNQTVDGQGGSSTASAINVQTAVGHTAWTSGSFTPTGSVSTATTRTVGVTTALRPAFPWSRVGIINPSSTRSATR